MNEWQPIETAPKNGTMFLTDGVCGYNLVRYQGKSNRWWNSWFVVECQGLVKSWKTLEEREITGWMPLPSPPTEDE